MKLLGPAVAIMVAFLVQTLGARYLLPLQRYLDLFAVATIGFGLVSGRMVGMATGTAAGLVQDAFSGGILGLNGLSKTTLGYLAGIAGRKLIIRGWTARFMYFSVASVLDLMVLAFVGLAVERPTVHLGVDRLVYLCVGNGLVGMIVMAATDKLSERR